MPDVIIIPEDKNKNGVIIEFKAVELAVVFYNKKVYTEHEIKKLLK